MKPNEITSCGFEQREIASKDGYWDDPRWKEVQRLRSADKQAEANSLCFKIQNDFGVD